jgi:NIMA (never in mitosis gene a)-related kinase
VYPKLPSQYSSDLSGMIASLLQVDPKKRPSTEQILHMPVFIAKYNETKRDSVGVFGEESKELIGTIRVPKNLSLLAERLPASQYDTDKAEGKIHSTGLGQIMEEDEPPSKPVNYHKPANSRMVSAHRARLGSVHQDVTERPTEQKYQSIAKAEES